MERIIAGGWLVVISLLAPLSHAASDNDRSLPRAVDLRQEAHSAARQGQPLVVLFSRSDCRYCEQVRRDFLRPLAHRDKDPLPVRQIDQDSDAPLRGFAGELTTHAAFAAQQKVKLVPVVAFYGPDGRSLSPPLVGVRLPDFYQSYLDDALEKSKARLAKSGP